MVLNKVQQWVKGAIYYPKLVKQFIELEYSNMALLKDVEQYSILLENQQDRILELSTQNSQLKIYSIKKPVTDKKYWDTKYKKSVIWYSAPKRKKVVDYVKHRPNSEINKISKRIINDNNINGDNPDDYVLACMKHFEQNIQSQMFSKGIKKKWSYKTERKEEWRTPEQTLELGYGDCFPEDTIIMDSLGNFVEMKDVEIGDTILGEQGQPVDVLQKWGRGEKEIYSILLRNNKVLRLSGEHKVLVHRTRKQREDNEFEEIKVKNLKLSDKFPTPKTLKFDENTILEQDQAYLVGLYLADGWTKCNQTFIAGRDDNKREQKEWVKTFCENRGLYYKWCERWIIIKDKDTTEFLRDFCSEGAYNKRLKKVNFNKETAKKILEGYQADAHVREDGNICYSTVNEQLALQICILSRVVGWQTNLKKVVKHGGFGNNPIYRIGVRRNFDTIGVKCISIEEEKQQCYDLMTSSGKVYLPTVGVYVRQCDDYMILEYDIIRELFNQLSVWENVKHRLKCVAGNVNKRGSIPSNAGGHAYLIWLAEDKEWYTVETTYYPEKAITNFKKLPQKHNQMYGTMWFTFNEDKSWAQNSITVTTLDFNKDE